MIVKRMPPAIWKAGSVMPNAEKIAPPVRAKIARISAAAVLARSAILRRSPGMPAVSDTKIGAASIGLMTEKRDENASTTNFASAEENMGADVVDAADGSSASGTRPPGPTQSRRTNQSPAAASIRASRPISSGESIGMPEPTKVTAVEWLLSGSGSGVVEVAVAVLTRLP